MIKNINNHLKKSTRINLKLRLTRYSLQLLLAISTTLDFIYNNQSKWHNLYKSLKTIILLITTILLLAFFDNLNDINKVFQKKKLSSIYEKYNTLLYTHTKRDIYKKWYGKCVKLYTSIAKPLGILFVISVLFSFGIELISFIKYKCEYLNIFISSSTVNNPIELLNSSNKLNGYTIFILTFFTLCYISLAINRFIKLLALFIKNNEINYLIKYNQNASNETERGFINAICKEKTKEFKILRFKFYLTILPTFILATAIFVLKFLQDFMSKKSIYLRKTLFALMIITIIYQAIRLIIYPLEYKLNTNYKIEYGNEFNKELSTYSQNNISDHLTADNIQNTFLNSITVEEIKKDIETSKLYHH